MSITGIGSAPVSFGVYGAIGRRGPAPSALLDGVVAAGFGGMELGPPGFFGDPDETADAFASRGLRPIGVYVPIHLSADEATVSRDLDRMQQSLDELTCAGSPPGLAILADEGSPELHSHPARSPDDRRHALDEAGWRRLIANVDRAMRLAERAGVPTSFHPHISTYVESAWEIERLLESTAVGLTLDTGHLWLAGADPLEQLARFGDRVDHVHLKDVRRAVLEEARAQGRSDLDAWWADVATPLGSGDLDLDGFIGALIRRDYDGWLVIEQDRLPLGSEPIAAVVVEQARNLRWVESVVAGLGSPAVPGTMSRT